MHGMTEADIILSGGTLLDASNTARQICLREAPLSWSSPARSLTRKL